MVESRLPVSPITTYDTWPSLSTRLPRTTPKGTGTFLLNVSNRIYSFLCSTKTSFTLSICCPQQSPRNDENKSERLRESERERSKKGSPTRLLFARESRFVRKFAHPPKTADLRPPSLSFLPLTPLTHLRRLPSETLQTPRAPSPNEQANVLPHSRSPFSNAISSHSNSLRFRTTMAKNTSSKSSRSPSSSSSEPLPSERELTFRCALRVFCAGSSPSTSKSSVLLSFPSPYHTNAETLLNTKKTLTTTTSSGRLRGKSGGSHDGLKAWREFYAVESSLSLDGFLSRPASTDVALLESRRKPPRYVSTSPTRKEPRSRGKSKQLGVSLLVSFLLWSLLASFY